MATLNEARKRILDHLIELMKEPTFEEPQGRHRSLSNPSGSPLDSIERLAEAFDRLSQGVVPPEMAEAHAEATAGLLRLIVNSDSVDSEIVAKASRAYRHLIRGEQGGSDERDRVHGKRG